MVRERYHKTISHLLTTTFLQTPGQHISSAITSRLRIPQTDNMAAITTTDLGDLQLLALAPVQEEIRGQRICLLSIVQYKILLSWSKGVPVVVPQTLYQCRIPLRLPTHTSQLT